MNEQGIDAASYQYLTKAIDLAQRMGLFGPLIRDDTDKGLDMSMKVVREVTAWALFAWQAVMSFMLYQPPLVSEPPRTSIPDPATNPSWYGDLWLRYPFTEMFLSARQSLTFNAYLKFWNIFNKIAIASLPPSSDRKLTVSQATGFYTQLRAWFDDLPETLRPGRIALPSQLKLHIQYWALLMDLFKPFAESDDEQIEGINKTPSSIYLEARLRLELVMRIYYLRHGSENYDSWLFMFLVKLGFASLQELGSALAKRADEEALRSTLILALTGIANQGKCYYMAEVVLRTICGQMAPHDLTILEQFITFKDIGDSQVNAERFKFIQSSWPIDMSFTDDPEWKNIHKVVARSLEGKKGGK
ncbi:hypothetical protein FGRMN_3046 [Fusarium graminum]|nr:hypothetical protein FGRMN_3046 [Fusarium graminum]